MALAATQVSDTKSESAVAKTASSELIACPNCDWLYQARIPEEGGRAVCKRCHTVLITTRQEAGIRILALGLAITILVAAAVFFPFLQISAAGIGNRASLLDIATSFRSGALVLVSAATVMLIVLVPLVRTLLLCYVLGPIVFGRRPAPHARIAFRTAQELKPWAMTEVFAIGCAVALAKVTDLARLEFGPAFWMFALLSVFVVIHDAYVCSWSIWKSLEDAE
ncbi:paraquat-inducible protein A [Pseudoruegeria sp. HB172150]|uniref:paraquat-inducible protein A n=1 Tax=Pseudoruegeria sp. HB172150 TaxID=2721164 RepID=UPI00155253D1|nr:paraquat-inducible protein A [Pseudoruegeria sp. HB172150]